MLLKKNIFFLKGLADVIPLEWLQMFDHKEFQVLISGAHIPVNLNDLRNHTQYTGTILYLSRL